MCHNIARAVATHEIQWNVADGPGHGLGEVQHSHDVLVRVRRVIRLHDTAKA